MAGYFAASGKAPLTALLLVTEYGGGLNQLMPLGVYISSVYRGRLLKMDPIYEVLAERLDKEIIQRIQRRAYNLRSAMMVDSPLVEKSDSRYSVATKEIIIATIRRGATKEIIARGDTVIRSGDI